MKKSEISTAVSIDIRGAKGPNAVIINGIYDPTEELCNDWPVYQKRGDPLKWLEFFNQSKKWYIKATNDRGKARGWMRLSSDQPTRPDLCKATCEVWDGSKWTSQPSVTIISARKRKEIDTKEGTARRIRAVPVNISGATGPSGPSINGIYEPTDEICGGWPVYHKKDDPEKWLEYIVATNEWYVKPTTDKGKAEGWMCISSDPPTRPELSKGACDVWDGERWTTQNHVLIEVVPGYFQSMTDIQIFCTEEIQRLNDRLSGTLIRTVNMVSGVPQEKIDEANAQLSAKSLEIAKTLSKLHVTKAEETKKNNAAACAAGGTASGGAGGAGGVHQQEQVHAPAGQGQKPQQHQDKPPSKKQKQRKQESDRGDRESMQRSSGQPQNNPVAPAGSSLSAGDAAQQQTAGSSAGPSRKHARAGGAGVGGGLVVGRGSVLEGSDAKGGSSSYASETAREAGARGSKGVLAGGGGEGKDDRSDKESEASSRRGNGSGGSRSAVGDGVDAAEGKRSGSGRGGSSSKASAGAK